MMIFKLFLFNNFVAVQGNKEVEFHNTNKHTAKHNYFDRAMAYVCFAKNKYKSGWASCVFSLVILQTNQNFPLKVKQYHSEASINSILTWAWQAWASEKLGFILCFRVLFIFVFKKIMKQPCIEGFKKS